MADNNKYSLENLVEDSLEAFKGMKIFHPFLGGQEETVDMTEKIAKFPRSYSMCSCTMDYRICTIGFIYNEKYYVTPFTHKAIKALKKAGFKERNFAVPLVYTEYPDDKELKEKWLELKAKAHIANDSGFVKACSIYSKKKGLTPIREEVLSRCLEMPYRHVTGYGRFHRCYSPIIRADIFELEDVEKLGIYAQRNNVTVFVNTTGHTYVVKGTAIIPELEAAGFKFVELSEDKIPFSDIGMEIYDEEMKAKWNSLEEF